MLRVDKAIFDVDEVICENIKQFGPNNRGLLSQNILSQARNLVEYVAIKEYSHGQDVDPNDYNLRCDALKDMQRHGDLRFLYRFHEMLQKSVSHYTVDKDGSERLMLKYYEHFLKIRTFLGRKYNMIILNNLCLFPQNTDSELSDYYEKIAERIDYRSRSSSDVKYNDRYYIQKIKPFFTDERIFYEVTFTAANSNTSKFDRVIAFTRYEIPDNYAVKLSIHRDTIQILQKEMTILIIDKYEVSIRPCEWDNLSEIFGPREKHSTSSIEYKELMRFLSTTKMSLTELVSSDQDYYDYIRGTIIERAHTVKIFNLLDQCRGIILAEAPGTNILRYLLHKMNNRVIKLQYSNERCALLSNLYFRFECIPFDQMPYCSSPRQHNPRLYDLFESIPSSGHEHELFARYIKNNVEIEGHLFTPKTEIEGFEDIDKLMSEYNRRLYYKHNNRRLEEFKGHIYIKEYAENSAEIIKRLQGLAQTGVAQYTASVDSWISKESYFLDDDLKKAALRQMFAHSHVALIYGSAGTGKSTLINHISNFWASKDKLFLANTHPAVDNLRRKVTAANSEYSTIAKFLSNRNTKTECDILVIDECSTVSNSDMRKILEKASFKLLVLVGDVHQIESIIFGNWFEIARMFIPQTSVFELTHPFRTTSESLLTVWDRVRRLDDAILEAMVKNDYVARLDDSIFERNNDDEIVLCLNYDGLYGINNVNRFLQNSNSGKSVVWGINTYKIGDPVLFSESNIFSPLIHNNSKGRIVDIRPEDKKIWFDIELEESINELDAWGYDFTLKGESDTGNSIISFSVNKLRNTDEDDDDNDSTVVPFQVAYAISIHKAQGLEYDSVKIVITNEIEERITHNIFYTAITRTKNKLKVFWSPETEQYVLSHLEIKDPNKDAHLLSALFSLSKA